MNAVSGNGHARQDHHRGTRGRWQVDDRKFFDRNPAKNYRVRAPFDGEILAFEYDGGGHLIEALKANALERDEFLVVVTKIQVDMRARNLCLKRPHGRVLTADTKAMRAGHIELKEFSPAELSAMVRTLDPEGMLPPERDDLDDCAVCNRPFQHGEPDTLVRIPGAALMQHVCNPCVPSLPPGTAIMGIGMYFKHVPEPGSPELRMLQAMSESVARFNKTGRH